MLVCWAKQLVDQASDVPSIIFSHFLQRVLKEIMKKIMLGTSDACSMSRLSQEPSKPAYYVEDCQISGAQLYEND